MSDASADKGAVPPVDRVRQEVDRWLDAVRSTGERAMETLGLTGANRPAVPAIDVVELSETIVVQIDLPGVTAEAVDLSLTGNTLTLVAGRIRPDFPAEARFHVRERMVGKYQRSISLPASVEDSAIHAETRDGLLTVTLRKSAPAPGRSIPVTRGNASHFPQ